MVAAPQACIESPQACIKGKTFINLAFTKLANFVGSIDNYDVNVVITTSRAVAFRLIALSMQSNRCSAYT